MVSYNLNYSEIHNNKTRKCRLTEYIDIKLKYIVKRIAIQTFKTNHGREKRCDPCKQFPCLKSISTINTGRSLVGRMWVEVDQTCFLLFINEGFVLGDYFEEKFGTIDVVGE